MNAADQNQSPEEIERRIEATRQQLSATLTALQNKLDPGELMDAVWSYLRENSGELSKSLVETIRANPIPVLLLGVGVSWLALGGSVPGRSGAWRGRHLEEDYAQSYDSNLGYEGGRAEAYPPGAVGYSTASGGGLTGKAKHSWQAAKEKMSEAAARVKGRTSEMADKFTDRTKETMEHMGERTQEMKDRLSHKLHTSDTGSESMSETASDKYQRLADRSQELYQRSMDRASQMSHGMRERYARQKYRARTLLEEHPLAVAAIGIGIGAFLGAILPASRKEQRWLRETSDEMGHGMLEAGREQFERARGVVERTAQAVREQAEQARHSDESLGESASRAAGAAKETARQERQEMKQEMKKEDHVGTSSPHVEPRKPITPPL